jgi:hypothetical protein
MLVSIVEAEELEVAEIVAVVGALCKATGAILNL